MLKNTTIRKMVVIESLVIIGVAMLLMFGRPIKAEAKEADNNSFGITHTLMDVRNCIEGSLNDVQHEVENSPEYRKIIRRAKLHNAYRKTGEIAGNVYHWGADRWDDAKDYYGEVTDGFAEGWNDAQ